MRSNFGISFLAFKPHLLARRGSLSRVWTLFQIGTPEQDQQLGSQPPFIAPVRDGETQHQRRSVKFG